MPTKDRVSNLEKDFFDLRTDSEDLLVRVFSAQQSADVCIEKICEQYASFREHLLGFLLARKLAEKEKQAEAQRIAEHLAVREGSGFAASILPEDLAAEQNYDDAAAERFVAVFTERVSRNGCNLALWEARFRTIFFSNQWPDAKKKPRALQKANIVELCRALRWDETDANDLLTRLFDTDGILGRSADDLIDVFSLRRPEISAQKIAEIRDAYRSAEAEPATRDVLFKNLVGGDLRVGTIGIQTDLYELMDNGSTDDFIAALIARKPHLLRNSVTAKNIVKILSYLAIHPDRLTQSSDPLKTVLDAVNAFDFARRAPDVYPDSLRRTVRFQLFYPVFENGKLAVHTLNRRIASLIDGKIPVQKNDILILLYYVSSLVWKNAGACDDQIAEDRVGDFQNCANALLKQAMLPEMCFYHPMELAIVAGICNGTDALDVYNDIKLLLDRAGTREKEQAKQARAAKAKSGDGKKQDQRLQRKCQGDGANIVADYTPLTGIIAPMVRDNFNTVFRFGPDGVEFWVAQNLTEVRRHNLVPETVAKEDVYKGTPLELLSGTAPEQVFVLGNYGQIRQRRLPLSEYANTKFCKAPDLYEENADEVHLRLVLNGLAAAVRRAVNCSTQIDLRGPTISFNRTDAV